MDDKNKKAANLCGVRGLFGEMNCLLGDQLSSGPDVRMRSHLHNGSRRMIAMGEECIE